MENFNQIESDILNKIKNVSDHNSYDTVKTEIFGKKGINGVPFFEIEKNFISGAQSVINLEKAIQSNF